MNKIEKKNINKKKSTSKKEDIAKRRDEILKFIVQDFIKTAEPVSSKMLVENNKLDYSGATVRTEMNKMEKEGLLKKIHNSSGRVPMDKAYEYYLLHILKNNSDLVDENFRKNLEEIICKKISSVDSIINESCKVIAEITNLAVMSSGEKNVRDCLKKITLIPMSSNSAKVSFSTDNGHSESKFFVFPEAINVDGIDHFIQIFNKLLKGTLINKIIAKMESLKPMLLSYGKDMIYKAILELFLDFLKKNYGFFGEDRLLYQPEFNDIENLKKILNTFNNPKKLELEIDKFDKHKIGDVDICFYKKNNISILSVPISFGDEINNKIYVLGPPRMDYDKTINLLNYLKNVIDDYFKNLGGKKCLKIQKKTQRLKKKNAKKNVKN